MISMGPSGKDLLDAPFSFQIGFGNAGRACCQGSIFFCHRLPAFGKFMMSLARCEVARFLLDHWLNFVRVTPRYLSSSRLICTHARDLIPKTLH